MFEISRSDLVLGAANAYAVFGLTRPIAFIGAAQAQTPAQSFREPTSARESRLETRGNT